jgi:hypothetical protein
MGPKTYPVVRYKILTAVDGAKEGRSWWPREWVAQSFHSSSFLYRLGEWTQKLHYIHLCAEGYHCCKDHIDLLNFWEYGQHYLRVEVRGIWDETQSDMGRPGKQVWGQMRIIEARDLPARREVLELLVRHVAPYMTERYATGLQRLLSTGAWISCSAFKPYATAPYGNDPIGVHVARMGWEGSMERGCTVVGMVRDRIYELHREDGEGAQEYVKFRRNLNRELSRLFKAQPIVWSMKQEKEGEDAGVPDGGEDVGAAPVPD